MRTYHISFVLSILCFQVLNAQTGKVGINTNSPLEVLHIHDTMPTLRLSNIGGDPLNSGTIQFVEDNAGAPNFQITYNGMTNFFSIQSSNPLADRLVINRDNGFVGIGTTSPGSLLEVKENAVETHSIGLTGTRLIFNRSDGASYIDKVDTNDLRFRMGNSIVDRVIFKNNGRVGIGTTTPLSQFHINGSTPTIRLGGNGGNPVNAGTIDFVEDGNTGDPSFTITHNGNTNRLAIQSSSANRLVINRDNGFVGIGPDAPQVLLHIGDGGLSLVNTSNTRVVSADHDSSERSAFIAVARDGSQVNVEAQMEADGGGQKIIMGAATNHPLHFRTNNQDCIIVNTSGDVGIGTDPQVKLHVGDGGVTMENGSNTRIVGANNTNGQRTAFLALARDGSSNSVEAQFEADGETPRVIVGSATAHDVNFRTDNQDRMIIDAAGLFAIGTTPLNYKLKIRQDGYFAPVRIENDADPSDDKANGLSIKAGATTFNPSYASDFIGFQNPNGVMIGKINQASSSSVAYVTTSDIRLKHRISTTRFGLDDLLRIKVYDYYFKNDDQTQCTGFLAQQLHSTYPVAVSVGGEDPKTDPWGVDYGMVTPLIVCATQELAGQVEEQQNYIYQLEQRINNLEEIISQLLENQQHMTTSALNSVE